MRSLSQNISLAALALALPAVQLGCGSDASNDSAIDVGGEERQISAQRQASGQLSAIALTSNQKWCIDIENNSSKNGTEVSLYSCNGSAAQSWTSSNGMIFASDGRCLNVKDGKRNNGAKLQIWSCSGSDVNSQFTVDGGQIKWKGNGKCLDLKNGMQSNSAELQLYTCNSDNKNQQWNFTAPSRATSGSSSDGTQVASATSSVSDLKKIAWSDFHHVKMARGAVNNEQEEYIDDGSTISVNSSGQLVIKAYVASNNNGATGKKTKWVSGRLTSRNVNATRGYIEARMKTPSAAGTWPAFWVMPSNNSPTWPQGGEIDIMEQVDGRNQQNVSTHYGKNPSQTKNTHLAVNLNNMSNTWHTYGLAFDTKHCAFYVDGKKIQTVQYPSDSPFARDMPNYGIILNLAMGGNWPKPAEPSIGPQYLITDYVAQSANVPSDF